MACIKVMDELLSNKIAAGEVVEKCVSIVKELVENAIDAKSTDIKIYLQESGIKEIKVIDNGIGMDKNDAILAFQRHATSKLYTDDDLFSITTLGFRGEALPSIASVSDVVLKTCQDNIGTMVHIKGGKILEHTSCEARTGTSITVSNLFYNTPARLKHLSTTYSELTNIIDYVQKISLSYSNIKFRLYNDEKEILNTDGSNNQLKVIKEIYGIDIAKKMIYLKNENNDYEISGYISLPEVTRASRNHMITLVNNRVIRNNELNRVINDSYHTFKEDTRYPITVINIKCDPELIDVNIHPSKLDIKFSNFEDLKNLITTTIIDKIKEKVLIPKIKIKEAKEVPKYENISIDFSNNVVFENPSEYQINFENQVDSKDIKIEDKERKEELEINNYIEDIKEEKLPKLYPVGLLLGTYIVCENEKGIYLIDQHAAKERINYEKYSYILSHPNNNTCPLIVPIIIELPKNDYIIVKENLNILEKININISEFGNNSFRITAHPTWFPTGYEKEIINKIIELIIQKEKDFTLEKFNDRLAMTVSCKMSKKANTYSSIKEMETLINDLSKCDNPYHCPHGRPTIITFTIYELEKMFKRSI